MDLIKHILHAEVLQKRKSHFKSDEIKSLVDEWINCESQCSYILSHLKESNVVLNSFSPEISNHVECVNISFQDTLHSPPSTPPSTPPTTPQSSSVQERVHHKINGINMLKKMSLTDFDVKYYVYQLNYESACDEEMIDDIEEGEQLPSAQHIILPSKQLNGLWESLIYDCLIKDQLLNFVITSLMFAEKNVNSRLITWNKVVLLHGPPGTGKTSLCKALAQKLSIRMKDKYKCSQLIEINSHSLFSKWFSESGKLVMKLFQQIKECVENGDQLIFVLIDEVESLAHTRQVSINGTEPSDAIRVVNALLTQIDNIKNYPNVVILTTSNVTGAIDLAFVDRADIKQFIGLPSIEAIYGIYRSCVLELVRSNIIRLQDESILNYDQLESASVFNDKNNSFAASYQLLEIAKTSQNLSGRTLRKIPFLALALFSNNQYPIAIDSFLSYLKQAVKKQFQERKELESN